MKLREFDKLLKRCQEAELNTFVQKHIFHGTPYLFQNRENEYFDFRNRIAKHLGVNYHEVFIVGSAKHGFSYKSNRDSFNLNSDVDVVVVNEQLFEKFCVILREYQYDLSGGTITHTQDERKLYNRFLRRFFVKGWIKPDEATFLINRDPFLSDWDMFFNSLSYGKSEAGNYKVAGGVFKSYDYLQRYHYRGLKNHLQRIRAK